MKILSVIIICLFLTQAIYAGTSTTHYSLYKPERGEVDWEDALSADFDTIDRTMYNLSQDTDGLSDDVEALRDYTEGLSGDVGALLIYTEGLSGDVEALRTYTENLDIGGLSGDVEALRTYTEGLSGDVGSIDTYVTGLSGDVDALRTYTEDLSEDVGSIDAYVTNLSEDVSLIDAYATGLSGDVEQVKDYAEGLSTDVEAVRDYSETLSTDVGAIYAKKSGNTYHGTHDFGGATFELPNSAIPAVDADGEMAFDTNDNQLVVFDGTNDRAITTSQDIDVLVFAPDSVNDEVMIFRVDSQMYPNGITISSVQLNQPSAASYKLPFEIWAAPNKQSLPNGWICSIDTEEIHKQASGDTDLVRTDMSADSCLVLDLPSTDVDWVHTKIVFYVNPN